jgi:hypothetical protein
MVLSGLLTIGSYRCGQQKQEVINRQEVFISCCKTTHKKTKLFGAPRRPATCDLIVNSKRILFTI